MKQAIIDYYRCPEDYVRLALKGNPSPKSGFFRFHPDITCYGECATGKVGAHATGDLCDVWHDAILSSTVLCLPFDPTIVVSNLRLERYRGTSNGHVWPLADTLLRDFYYLLRPITPGSIRSRVQQMYFRGWKNIPFPQWPVDLTVDRLFQNLLMLLLQNGPDEDIPFIWFWPDGKSSCAVMTHDVETCVGLDFCSDLMDIDESWGIKSSFQIIPEDRYHVPTSLLDEMRMRGFEINIHDLNHDGRLFRDFTTFRSRVQKINAYAKDYGAHGFRAGAMYRQPEWFAELNVSYDMSIPNSAHMEPQRGGCCTVMPFFVGDILELPLTTTQDWAMFNVLQEHTTELWQRQMQIIANANGMASFITHPDYLITPQAQTVYSNLLSKLSDLKESNVWMALPREINQWWRERALMQLCRIEGRWTVVGEGKQRARIAHARLVDGKLSYSIGPPECDRDSLLDGRQPGNVSPRQLAAVNS